VILGAALLVLVALGLFVGGIATGATAFYWACVAVSVLAAVLLFVARRRMGRAIPDDADRPAGRRAVADERGPAAPPQRVDDGPDRAGERAPAPEAVAGHRADEDGDGRVSAPEQDEPAGTVSGAAAAGIAQERAGGAAGEPSGALAPADDGGEPPVEEVEMTDLLLVVDLRDEVLVVDEHPRYHVATCPWLAGRTAIPLPLDEARADGFTPCGRCTPDRHLAEVERARRAEGRTT
jgi:hypothetical protein